MKNLFTILFLSIIMYGNAQINLENINLNDYKQIDYKYKSMGLYFKLNGDFEGKYRKKRSSETYEGNSINELIFKMDVLFIKNNAKKQLERRIGFRINPQILASKDINENERVKLEFNSSIYYNQKVKHYFLSKLFFENDMSIWSSHDYSKIVDFDSKGFNYTRIELPLLIGFGRVENITSAWHAFRIVDDLYRRNLYIGGNDLDREDIVRIADYITDRNYTRVFDRRIKKQENLIGLTESYLKGKVDICDPRVYASLYDMWDYGVNTIRRTGSTFAIGFEPRFSHIKSSLHSPHESISKNLDLFAITRFEYYHALGMKWQLDFEIELKAGVEDIIDFDDSYASETPILGGKFDLGLGYYPNTRTSFSSHLYLNGITRGGDAVFDGSNYLNFAFKNNLYYYISPQLRLRLNLDFGNRTSSYLGDEFIDSDAKFSYGLSFNYYIF